MTLSDVLILPIIHQFKLQYGLALDPATLSIASVTDTTTLQDDDMAYSGGRQCIYDITTNHVPGVRVRGYYVNNEEYAASQLTLDRVTELTFNDNRTMYTIAVSLPIREADMYARGGCPKLSSELECTLPILTDEEGTAILAEDGSFIYY